MSLIPAAAFPLSVSGAQITGADGSTPRLCGVNWGGAQQDGLLPYGLDKLPREQIISRITGWGLNHVRFPFSLGAFVTNGGTPKNALADVTHLSANLDLVGMTPFEVYCQLARDMTAAGLYVILNQHLLFQGWPVPETTEILTRSGWKHCFEVVPGEDETLGWQDGELTWTPITRVLRRGNQPVVRFGSDRWNTTCTPDHKWLTQQAFPRNNRPVEWGPVIAESAFTAWHSKNTPRGIAGTRRLVLTGYAGDGKSPCTPDEARVIAWLKTDGSVTWRTDNGGVTAYITQSESKHATEIRALLLREDAMTSETTDTHPGFRKTVMRRFRIKAAYVRHLWATYPLDDGDLVIFVMSLSREARAAFLDAWRKADGSGSQISARPEPRRDAIALTAFLEGYLVQVYAGERHHGINLSSGYQPNNGPNAQPVYEDAGMADVWCPTTGLGSWVARDEDGRIFITGNCCSNADNNGLWYNSAWPPSTFFSVWSMLASVFRDNPMVGYDLHNEPRPADIGGRVLTPSWGDGNPATDMREAYQGAADLIHAVHPGALVFCEGLGYGADLSQAEGHPVTGPGVVYSAHDYPWYGHPAGQSLIAYYDQMDASCGYLVRNNVAPVWIGEFGTGTDGPPAALDTGWFQHFLSYADARGLHTCWWELSATAVKGTQPVTNMILVQEGQRESYGLMSGQDWLGSQTDVLALLRPLLS